MIRIRKDVAIVAGRLETAIYQFSDCRIFRVSHSEARRIEDGDLTPSEVARLQGAHIIELGSSVPSVSFNGSAHADARPDVNDLCAVWVELTDCCNLRCVHCYLGCAPGKRHSVIAEVTVEKLAEYFAHWRVGRLILIGGEPFCYVGLWKVVGLFRRILPQSWISIVTNGTLCTEKDILLAKAYECELKFPVLGSNKTKHDFVTRTEGSFDRVCDSIHLAIRHDVKFKLTSVDFGEDKEEMQRIRSFCRNAFGTDEVHFSKTRPQGRGHGCHVRELENECNLAVNVSPAFFKRAHLRHPCLYGKFAVSAEGRVFPCVMARYVHMDLIDVLEKEPCQAFAQWWNLTKDQVRGCQDCALRYACFDCRGYADGLHDPPSNCILAQQLRQQK